MQDQDQVDVIKPDVLHDMLDHLAMASSRGPGGDGDDITDEDCIDGGGPPESHFILLDLQSPQDYQSMFIKGSFNLNFPSIIVRRLKSNKVNIFEKSEKLEKLKNDKIKIVVYDSFISDVEDFSEIVLLISRKLAENGCHVSILKGGLHLFRQFYPEWIDINDQHFKCDSSIQIQNANNKSPLNNNNSPIGLSPGSNSNSNSSNSSDSQQLQLQPTHNTTSTTNTNESKLLKTTINNDIPLLGLGGLASLKILDEREPKSNQCDSSIGLDEDIFPVEIIPFLYLGNATNSNDIFSLERYNIKHILNCTTDLPNTYEKNSKIRYLQIPISDHWSQSMMNYFPKAIAFIDEGRQREEGVLIHCLAGISRSVTFTLAYIMFKCNMSLDDAFDLVKRKKDNISPNFQFIRQLLEFERELNTDPPALSLNLMEFGTSPDSGIGFSGIEFDLNI